MKNLLCISYKIEPLFYKIVYMSIIASIIGISILIIKKILKKEISPRWTNKIWLIFLISLVIPIQIKCTTSVYNTIPINFEKIENISISRDEYILKNIDIMKKNYNLEDQKNLANIQSSESSLQFNIIAFLPLIWLIIVVASIVACIITYIVFEKMIKDKEIQNENLINILNIAKEKLNIKRKIKLIKQDIIKMPSIFGIFNIRILINDNILELSDKEIEYIFMHELAHYKRKDNILILFVTILRYIYIFNPLVWILLSELKNDLELAVDFLVIENESIESQKEYSRTLVKVSAINSDKFLIQAMCLSDSKRNLEKRIDNVKLVGKFKKKNLIVGLISIIVMVLLVLVLWTRSDNYMSEKDIERLCNKASSYENAHVISEVHTSNKYDEENDFKESYTLTNYYCKGKIVYEETSGKDEEVLEKLYYRYINYDTNEAINILNNPEKSIIIMDLSNVTEENRASLFVNRFIPKIEFNEEDIISSTYKYCGREYLNDREVYKIEKNIKTFFAEQKLIQFIDKEKGLLLREETQYTYLLHSDGDLKESYRVSNYTYEFNSVTDENIKKPNLEDYPDYEIFEDNFQTMHY